MLVAMSIVQDGSGFSFLAPPVYQYICGMEIPRIAIADEDVPDYEVRKLIEEVCVHIYAAVCMRGCSGPFPCTCMHGVRPPLTIKDYVAFTIVHVDQQS